MPSMYMTFRATGQKLDFTALESASGIKATHTSSKSQRPAAIIAQGLAFDAWDVRVDVPDCLDTSRFMQEFCARIAGNTLSLGDALEKASAHSCFSYCIETESSDNPDVSLGWTAEQLRCMYETHADLDIDSYVFNEACSRSGKWADCSWVLSLSGLNVDPVDVSSAIALQPSFSSDSEWEYRSSSIPIEPGVPLSERVLSSAFAEEQCRVVHELVENHSAKAHLVLRASRRLRTGIASMCLSNSLIGMIARMDAGFEID